MEEEGGKEHIGLLHIRSDRNCLINGLNPLPPPLIIPSADAIANQPIGMEGEGRGGKKLLEGASPGTTGFTWEGGFGRRRGLQGEGGKRKRRG
jgi:hypothetical protein